MTGAILFGAERETVADVRGLFRNGDRKLRGQLLNRVDRLQCTWLKHGDIE